MALQFRGYRKGDARAMFALDQVCFDERFRFTERAMLRFAEAPNAIVWLAEDLSEIAGFAIGHMEPDGVYLVTLDVAPRWRRHGLAGELVSRIEQSAVEACAHAAWLHVFSENLAAISFYERRGYLRLGLSEHLYGVGLHGYVYRYGLTHVTQKQSASPARKSSGMNILPVTPKE